MPLDPRAIDAALGPAWAMAWSDAVDAALGGWLRAHQRGVAVVALGSYARRELCPSSDVDLLLLHDGWGKGDLEQLVRSLCYPLWDAGLQVGHAVHTPREAVAAMRGRLDSATALSDRRLVAGDPGLADALAARVSRWLRRDGGRLLSEIATTATSRHDKGGVHPGMLEPDLKRGRGGLRDLHALAWGSACVLGEAGIDPLVGARYLSARERRELALARDQLLTVRCALHLVQGRSRSDVLRLEVQDEVAALTGLGDGDELLRAVGMAMRAVAHVFDRVVPILVRDAERGRQPLRARGQDLGGGTSLVDGFVEIDGRPADLTDAALGLRAVAQAARHGTHLGRRAADYLARRLAGSEPAHWTPAMVEDLLGLLAAGSDGLPALRDADHLGLLAVLWPEWALVRGRRQRNPYHRYDLDTHLLVTVAWLRRVAEGELEPGHAKLWAGLTDPGALLLAGLLHDVGKAWPGDHSVVGARVADRWLSDMGLDQRRRAHVARLIGLHLLLPDTATRRDIDDEGEIVAVAERVGSGEILDGLYLLAVADGRATGPSAHSPWKEALLARLHERVRRVLDEDAPGAVVQDPAAVVAAVRRSASEAATAAVEDLITQAPRRYLLAATPEQCLAHAELAAIAQVTNEPAVGVRPAEASRTSVLSVAAPDRIGLVAACAAALAGAGVGVLEARAFTLPGTGGPSLALDWYVLDAAVEDLPARLADEVAAAAAGRLDVDGAIERAERRRRPRVVRSDAEVDVRIELSGREARVEVHAPDGPGLLARLARTLAVAGLDVAGVRAATLGPIARDVFFVRWPEDADPIALERTMRLAAGQAS